jgi:hypothetical protein
MGFWDISPRRPLDRDFGHITGFGSPRIDEWMEKLHGEEYSLKIDLRLGYHQSKDREQDTCRVSLRCYIEFLVVPLELMEHQWRQLGETWGMRESILRNGT